MAEPRRREGAPERRYEVIAERRMAEFLQRLVGAVEPELRDRDKILTFEEVRDAQEDE